LPAGVYRATVDLPYQWASPQVTTSEGAPLLSLASTIPGERDPLHGNRSRVQMAELVVWLERGEIHEYQLRNSLLTCEEGQLRLVADLWPAALGYAPETNPAAAQMLVNALADPSVQSFFVHLRMPRRYALLFRLEEPLPVDHLILRLAPASEEEKRTIHFFMDDALASDPSEFSLTVQLS
jgi:hypothetical protein